MNKNELYKQLEKHFKNNPLASLEFIVDGFKVSIGHRFTNNRLVKVIFVNGVNKGAWINDDSYEETKRFSYVSCTYLMSTKRRKQLLDLAKSLKDKQRRDDMIEYANIRSYCKAHLFKCTIGSVLKQWIDRDINKSIILLDDHNGNTNIKLK